MEETKKTDAILSKIRGLSSVKEDGLSDKNAAISVGESAGRQETITLQEVVEIKGKPSVFQEVVELKLDNVNDNTKLESIKQQGNVCIFG